MTRTIFLTTLYLILALELEVAILPQFQMLAPPTVGALLDLKFLALGGILIGLLRGEIQGMIVALVAACLFGFSQPPGGLVLGPCIVSYVSIAFLAGLEARTNRPQRPLPVVLSISALLVIERVLWCLTRKFFKADTPFDIPWLAILLAALIGFFVYKLLLPKLRLALSDED